MQTDQPVTSRDLHVPLPQAAQRIDAPGPDHLRPASGARAWEGAHAVNLRLTLPWLFGKRFYLIVVAGQERRSAERRAEERLRHPVGRFGNLVLLFAVGAIVGLALLAALQLAAVLVLQRSGALIGA